MGLKICSRQFIENTFFKKKAGEMKESAATPISKENTFIALFLTIGSVLFAVVELVGLRRACPSSDV